MFPSTLTKSIRLTVEHWNGKGHFTVESAPNDYIDDIKDTLSSQENIPLDELRISYKGRPVRDDMNLLEQNIVDGSILKLEPMRVLFELPLKKGITKLTPIQVQLNQSIGDIKKMIAKKLMGNIDPKLLSILYFGEQLDVTSTISECGIDHLDEVKIELFTIKVVDAPSGEMFALSGLGPTSTTYDVKKEISKFMDLPIDKQIVRLQDKKLHDVVRLKDQGVKHRSVLILDPKEEVEKEEEKEDIVSPVIKKEKTTLTIFDPVGTSSTKKRRSSSRRHRNSVSSSSSSRRSSTRSSTSSSASTTTTTASSSTRSSSLSDYDGKSSKSSKRASTTKDKTGKKTTKKKSASSSKVKKTTASSK